MEDYITIKREFIEQLRTMPGDVLKVYLYLLERQKRQAELKIGLSLPELARQTDLGTEATKHALWWLGEKQLIELQKKSNHDLILIHEFYPGEKPIPIPFTYKNTDEGKIVKVEQELHRLQMQTTRDILRRESGIANACKGEERNVVMEIERDLGRGFTREESYLLGRCMSAFGPDRVQATWRRSAFSAKNPIPALSAMMWNKSVGKPAKPREEKEEFVRRL